MPDTPIFEPDPRHMITISAESKGELIYLSSDNASLEYLKIESTDNVKGVRVTLSFDAYPNEDDVVYSYSHDKKGS
jgi:hypothetical protein